MRICNTFASIHANTYARHTERQRERERERETHTHTYIYIYIYILYVYTCIHAYIHTCAAFCITLITDLTHCTPHSDQIYKVDVAHAYTQCTHNWTRACIHAYMNTTTHTSYTYMFASTPYICTSMHACMGAGNAHVKCLHACMDVCMHCTNHTGTCIYARMQSYMHTCIIHISALHRCYACSRVCMCNAHMHANAVCT